MYFLLTYAERDKKGDDCKPHDNPSDPAHDDDPQEAPHHRQTQTPKQGKKSIETMHDLINFGAVLR